MLQLLKYSRMLYDLYFGSGCDHGYLNGFGGGGIKVGETSDPSKIVGEVGNIVVLGWKTDDMKKDSDVEFWTYLVEFQIFKFLVNNTFGQDSGKIKHALKLSPAQKET